MHSNNGVDRNYKLRNLQLNTRIMDDPKTAQCCCVCRRKERYFLVIDTLQLILVEPEMRRLGWGVVTFVGYLQVCILSHAHTMNRLWCHLHTASLLTYLLILFVPSGTYGYNNVPPQGPVLCCGPSLTPREHHIL